MKSPRLAVRRAGRPGTSAADVSRSLMYAGEWPMSDLWTSRHSLNSILCLIGNQCNSRRAEDTWSRGRRSMTTRAAACSTRCNGANVDAGSSHNGDQQRQLSARSILSRHFMLRWRLEGTGWFRGSAVERWSSTGELSLSCARPTADGWPLTWVNRPL